jgi:hypothetical protein
VNMNIIVFWDVMPCSLIENYLRFGRACCFRLQGRRVFSSTLRMEVTRSSKMLVPLKLHGVIFQEMESTTCLFLFHDRQKQKLKSLNLSHVPAKPYKV